MIEHYTHLPSNQPEKPRRQAMTFKEFFYDMLGFLPAFGIILLIILAFAVLKEWMGGVEKAIESSKNVAIPVDIKVYTIEGHKYIIANDKNNGGRTRAIIHAESCPCKQSNVSKED